MSKKIDILGRQDLECDGPDLFMSARLRRSNNLLFKFSQRIHANRPLVGRAYEVSKA